MPVFILHDTRVDGTFRPHGLDREVLRVEPGDLLEKVVDRLLGMIERNPCAGDRSRQGFGNELVLLCHGTSNGLMLGGPTALTQHDVGAFLPLRGCFALATIRACGAALIYNRGATPAGPYDGAAFCRRLAQCLRARVTAADATQPYASSEAMWNTSGDIVLPGWAGNVGTWDRNGALVGFSTPADRQRTQP